MEKDLKKFMENVNILNKDFSEYEQKDKGFYFVLGTAQLICGCEYAELDELQLKTALFNQEIEKDVEVSKVWIVRNQLKLSKSFNNKEEAVKFAKSINEKVINAIK